MTQYGPEDIASNISPIEAIRRLYSHRERKPDGAELVIRLVYDLCLTGAVPIAVEQVENWWLVVSDKDWLVSPEGTPSMTNFSKIVPFPIAGDNCNHAEILITAFSNAAVTQGTDGIFWICGDHDWSALPDRFRERLSRLERGRGVAFSIS